MFAFYESEYSHILMLPDLKIEAVSERDIDLLILEELTVSQEFAQFFLNDVGVDLMKAHVEATTRRSDGWLSPQEIADYHHDVFSIYNLPAKTFGGTPITGGLWEASITRRLWCGWCR